MKMFDIQNIMYIYLYINISFISFSKIEPRIKSKISSYHYRKLNKNLKVDFFKNKIMFYEYQRTKDDNSTTNSILGQI